MLRDKSIKEQTSIRMPPHILIQYILCSSFAFYSKLLEIFKYSNVILYFNGLIYLLHVSSNKWKLSRKSYSTHVCDSAFSIIPSRDNSMCAYYNYYKLTNLKLKFYILINVFQATNTYPKGEGYDTNSPKTRSSRSFLQTYRTLSVTDFVFFSTSVLT